MAYDGVAPASSGGAADYRELIGAQYAFYNQAILPQTGLHGPTGIELVMQRLAGRSVQDTEFTPWIFLATILEADETIAVPGFGDALSKFDLLELSLKAGGNPMCDAQAWIVIGDELQAAADAVPTPEQSPPPEIRVAIPGVPGATRAVAAQEAYLAAIDCDMHRAAAWLGLAKTLTGPNAFVRWGRSRLTRADCLARFTAIARNDMARLMHPAPHDMGFAVED